MGHAQIAQKREMSKPEQNGNAKRANDRKHEGSRQENEIEREINRNKQNRTKKNEFMSISERRKTEVAKSMDLSKNHQI